MRTQSQRAAAEALVAKLTLSTVQLKCSSNEVRFVDADELEESIVEPLRKSGCLRDCLSPATSTTAGRRSAVSNDGVAPSDEEDENFKDVEEDRDVQKDRDGQGNDGRYAEEDVDGPQGNRDEEFLHLRTTLSLQTFILPTTRKLICFRPFPFSNVRGSNLCFGNVVWQLLLSSKLLLHVVESMALPLFFRIEKDQTGEYNWLQFARTKPTLSLFCSLIEKALVYPGCNPLNDQRAGAEAEGRIRFSSSSLAAAAAKASSAAAPYHWVQENESFVERWIRHHSRMGQQQDAAEFLLFVIELLSSETLLKNSTVDTVQDGFQSGAKVKKLGANRGGGEKERASILQGLFEGFQVVAKVEKKIVLEPFYVLTLPPFDDINDVLTQKLAQLPPVLVIQIERVVFDPQKGRVVKKEGKMDLKLKLKIAFDSLTDSLQEQWSEAGPTYTLRAMICHKGAEPGYGHYLCYRAGPNREQPRGGPQSDASDESGDEDSASQDSGRGCEWFSCNDSTITPRAVETLPADPYILLYEINRCSFTSPLISYALSYQPRVKLLRCR